MPIDIRAEWPNLPKVRVSRVVIHSDSTEIYVDRDAPLDFTCSGCGQTSFWSWDCR